VSTKPDAPGPPSSTGQLAVLGGLVAAGVFWLLALLFFWLQTPSEPGALTRVDPADPCLDQADPWWTLGFVSLLTGGVVGPTLIIVGVIRLVRRADKSGAALILAGVLALAMAVSAWAFLDDLSAATTCG
jgi:hypothetical protein